MCVGGHEGRIQNFIITEDETWLCLNNVVSSPRQPNDVRRFLGVLAGGRQGGGSK